ncbi:MAG: ATP F0F1 synthase subunit B [Hyphomicrobiales bacterium]
MVIDAAFFAFVALVIFLGIVVWAGAHRTAAKMLDDRTAQISKDLADARKLREDAEKLLADYKQKRLDAEKEAADIVARAKADAAAYAEESKKKLADMLERRTKQAETKIAQAEDAAKKDVRAAAADLAVAAAQSLLKDGMKGKGGESLIADSIAAVKARLN